MFPGFGFRAVNNTGECKVGEVGGETGYGVAGAPGHGAGEGVGMITKLGDGPCDPLARLRQHALAVIDDTRDGLMRDASISGYIADGDPIFGQVLSPASVKLPSQNAWPV